MKKIKFEEMFPDELLEVIREKRPVYLPVSPMEWHGPHMGMGTDAVHAYAVAERLAERIWGAVYPALYIGTDSKRDRISLKKLGLDENLEVIGMDFPENSVKSCYWTEEMFRQILNAQIKMLEAMGFERIVILNGHGAAAQRRVIREICDQENREGKELLGITLLFPECGTGLGHAGLYEASLIRVLRPEMVDPGRLPDKLEVLLCRKYGIADAGISEREDTGDGACVKFDPRDADEETGRRIIEYEITACEKMIRERYEL